MGRGCKIWFLTIAALLAGSLHLLSAEPLFKLRLDCKEALACGAISKGDTIVVRSLLWGEPSRKPAAYCIAGRGSVTLPMRNPAAGEYVVELRRASAAKSNLMEFFISKPGESRMERYSISFKDDKFLCSQSAGSAENRLLALLNSAMRQFFSGALAPDAAKSRLDSIYAESLKLPKSSAGEALFTQLCRLTLDKESGRAKHIRYTLPLDDPRLLHTNFGKTAVDSYLKAVEYNSTENLLYIADELVRSSCKELRPYIALQIFERFKESEIMGHEGVAVEIAKRYLLEDQDGMQENSSLPDYDKEFEVRAFVQMNENSLIGMQAPVIELADTSGTLCPLPLQNAAGAAGEAALQLFYFYAPDCSTCRLVTPLLLGLLQRYKGVPIHFYAIFTGDKREVWMEEIKRMKALENPLVERRDFWDPKVESNYPLLYGVISTPQMLLTTDKGVIIGRRLTPSGLEQLLKAINEN